MQEIIKTIEKHLNVIDDGMRKVESVVGSASVTTYRISNMQIRVDIVWKEN